MKTKIIFIIISLFVCFGVGFWLGRTGIKIKTETTYTVGETVSGTVSYSELLPVSEKKPEAATLPMKTDTVIIYNERVIIQQIDTAKIIADYVLQRSYNVLAFDSKQYGKLELFPIVQYNRLSGMDYRFTPQVKETRVYRKDVFRPFVSGSYQTFDYIGVGGGFFYHKVGVEYLYVRNLKSNINGHSFGLKYSF